MQIRVELQIAQPFIMGQEKMTPFGQVEFDMFAKFIYKWK